MTLRNKSNTISRCKHFGVKQSKSIFAIAVITMVFSSGVSPAFADDVISQTTDSEGSVTTVYYNPKTGSTTTEIRYAHGLTTVETGHGNNSRETWTWDAKGNTSYTSISSDRSQVYEYNTYEGGGSDDTTINYHKGSVETKHNQYGSDGSSSNTHTITNDNGTGSTSTTTNDTFGNPIATTTIVKSINTTATTITKSDGTGSTSTTVTSKDGSTNTTTTVTSKDGSTNTTTTTTDPKTKSSNGSTNHGTTGTGSSSSESTPVNPGGSGGGGPESPIGTIALAGSLLVVFAAFALRIQRQQRSKMQILEMQR